ncbi:phage tail protein [Lactobacillus plantarum]|uniref:HK97 gp10 family phage protein n=1 Tax=Lactiplantibacillus plantarum TaxID=1590 RepID=UPI00143DD2C3|nr:phage tail protein [Lactiplantibacillus plantarum]MBE1727402.1 phage tail protein [Lactiplantibacillus plantarum]NKI39449.1 phage tail protein [Lactiplantibacillus plantarum]
MAKEVRNVDAFEHILDEMASGFGRDARRDANKAGADEFIKVMKPKIPEGALRNVHGSAEKVHLRDSLIEDEHPNGSVSVGFTAKGQKGYIGRFQNDGWDATDRNGGKHKHVTGKHFWESSQSEARGKVGMAVARQLKSDMDKKVGK